MRMAFLLMGFLFSSSYLWAAASIEVACEAWAKDQASDIVTYKVRGFAIETHGMRGPLFQFRDFHLTQVSEEGEETLAKVPLKIEAAHFGQVLLKLDQEGYGPLSVTIDTVGETMRVAHGLGYDELAGYATLLQTKASICKLTEVG